MTFARSLQPVWVGLLIVSVGIATACTGGSDSTNQSTATATTADAAAAPTSTPADSQPDTLEPTPTQAAAAQPTETTVPEPTATQPPATQAPPGPPSLPDTPVSAAIDQAYSYTDSYWEHAISRHGPAGWAPDGNGPLVPGRWPANPGLSRTGPQCQRTGLPGQLNIYHSI